MSSSVGFSEELDKSSLQSAADFAKEMDIESARLRQFPSSVHHPLKKSDGQTDSESKRDTPHEEVTSPLSALSTTNGTRSGVTLHGRTSRSEEHTSELQSRG